MRRVDVNVRDLLTKYQKMYDYNFGCFISPPPTLYLFYQQLHLALHDNTEFRLSFSPYLYER
jgi:hypothetical protein